jgi:hypothetical protein
MSFLAISGTNVMFLAIGGTYVDLIEGGTNVGGTNVGGTYVGGTKVAASLNHITCRASYSLFFQFLTEIKGPR